MMNANGAFVSFRSGREHAIQSRRLDPCWRLPSGIEQLLHLQQQHNPMYRGDRKLQPTRQETGNC